jgi:hypothetical protein
VPVAPSAKTSAANPVAAAEKPVTHPATAHVVAAKAKAKPAAPKSAALLRAKASSKKTMPRKLTQAEIAALKHPAAKPAQSPAMQAFLTESPKPATTTPRTVTRVQIPTPVSRTPAAAAQSPAPVQQPAPPPRLIIHPGFNSSGGQP